MRFLVVVLIALAFQSCSKNKAEERRAEQPTEVSGGFGLTMECRVLNKDSGNDADTVAAASQQSRIGCLVFNDDGSRFKGQITEAKTDVTAKDGTMFSVDRVSIGSGPGEYSFVADVPFLKPSDASSLKITAKFDGRLEKLMAGMSRDAQVCENDVTYYVRHQSENPAYEKNIMCTKDAPCSQIMKAIDLIPNLVDCKITIDVGPGTYEKSDSKIWLTKSEVITGGRILIRGHLDEYKNLKTIIKTDGAQWVRTIDLSGSKLIAEDDLTFDSLRIDCGDPRHIGPNIIGSSVKISNLEINDCLSGIKAVRDSRVSLSAISISNPVNSGIEIASSTAIGVGDLTIVGGRNSRSDSVGLRLDDGSSFFANSRVDWLTSMPYFNLGVSGVGTGITLNNNSVMYLHEGDNVSISEVNEGIYAFAGSSVAFRKRPLSGLLKDKLDPTDPAKKPSPDEAKIITDLDEKLRGNPARLSIKDFVTSGVSLGRDGLFSDGDIYTLDLDMDSSKEYDCDATPPKSYNAFYTIKKVEIPGKSGQCRYITKKPIIELHDKVISADPAPLSTFMRADASTLALRFSSLELCGSRLSKAGTSGEYAFSAVNGGLMILAWDQSPFFKECGTTLKSVDSVAKHVMTFSELFYAQSAVTGQEGLCPLNYVKSGDLCYGRLGYFYHHPLRHPNLIAYLGVLPRESRVDLLPAPPMVSSVKMTPPSIIAAGNEVTIEGQWFMKGATVTVGGSPCLNPVANAAGTNITCTLPTLPGPASARVIQVTNPITGKTSNTNVTVTY